MWVSCLSPCQWRRQQTQKRAVTQKDPRSTKLIRQPKSLTMTKYVCTNTTPAHTY